MITNVVLPQWLDDLIFNELGAKYCRSNSDMTVIDWDRNDIINYLGTYFPRSYAESYCIAKECLEKVFSDVRQEKNISIFDFCCGTGGEIVGLLSALDELPKRPLCVSVYALDGNPHALRLSEKVIQKLSRRLSFGIEYKPILYSIDDIFDLDILKGVITRQFDIIISFKAICEFVTKDKFDLQNPYESVAKFFLPMIKDGGSFLLTDVTTYNEVSQEWLPKQMDKGLLACCNKVIFQNEGFNQSFYVTHSQRRNDVSKVAWRIFK